MELQQQAKNLGQLFLLKNRVTLPCLDYMVNQRAGETVSQSDGWLGIYFIFFCSPSRIGGKQDLLGVAPPYPWFLFSISSTKNFSDNSQKSNRNGKTLALWSTQYRSSASILDARQSEHLSRLRKVYLASRLFGCQEKTPLTSFFFLIEFSSAQVTQPPIFMITSMSWRKRTWQTSVFYMFNIQFRRCIISLDFYFMLISSRFSSYTWCKVN